MGSEGCIWLNSARRTGPVAIAVPSGAVRAAGVVASWRWRWLVVVVLGWVKVKIGTARSGTMPSTQVGTTARVLDGCNSPSLPMSG